MAKTAELDSRDMLAQEADENEGVLDYKMLVQGIPRIEPVSQRDFLTVEQWEKFMAEQLVIVVAPTADKNAPPAVPVGNNGLIVWLPRDRKIRIPRSYVERLAQSQEIGVRTETNPDHSADEGMRMRQSTSQPYPFSVIFDPSGLKGERWLRNVIRRG